jgi:starch phosphorylase
LIASGFFNPEEPNMFRPITDNLLGEDPFRLMADFEAYVQCQRRVEKAYMDRDFWDRAAVLNIANMGRFSSDRSIRDYAKGIWNVAPIPVVIPPYGGSHSA